MADDLLKLIQYSYKERLDQNNDYEGGSLNNTNKALNKKYGIDFSGLSEYTDEVDKITETLKEVKEKEKERYEKIFKEELKLQQYSTRLKNDTLKREMADYTKMYNVKLNNEQKLNEIYTAQAETYKEIGESGKVSLGNLAELYTRRRELEEIEKDSIEYKEKQFKKNVDKVKNAIHTVIRHIIEYYNKKDNLLHWNQWNKGITELGSKYESNFTEIAARNGSDTQMETHLLIKDTLSKITSNENLKKGLNFNEEVFPEITNAVKNGFMGDEATEIAISNAIDKKIVPWLDTSNETWVQLQYLLSDNMLTQVKGQQMLLQESREGNRILQNGVVSTLLESLAPTLQAIDANTVSKDSMGDSYEIVENLMARGMDKTTAVKFTRDLISADQHTFDALTSNDTSKILMGIGAMNGGGVSGAFNSYRDTIGTMLSGSEGNEIAIGAIDSIIGGKYLPADFDNFASMYDFLLTEKYNKDGSANYNQTLNNLNSFTTATQQNDNKQQNAAAEFVFDRNLVAHGIDLAAMQLDEVKQIKEWLFVTLGSYIAYKGADKLVDGGISKFLTKFKSDGIGQGASGLFKSSSKTLGKGLLSSGASTAAKITGGAAGALGLGVAITAGKDAAEEMKFARNENNLTVDREEAKKDATMSAVAGGLGAVGAIVGLLISGPIGAIIALIGGGVLAFKKHNDELEKARDATELLTQGFVNAKQKIKEEHDAKDKELRSIRSTMNGYSDVTEKLEYLKKQGLDPNISAYDLQNKTTGEINKELDKYLNNLIIQNKKDGKEDQKTIDTIGGKIKTQYNKDAKKLKNKIYGELKGKSKDEQYEMLSLLGYSDEDLEALFTNKADGAATEGELWRFLDEGGTFHGKKGIESFANRLGSGKISADDVNSFNNLYMNGNAPMLYDQSKLTADEINKVYQAAEYLYKYKSYGRKKDPITTNVPSEFKQDQYNDYKSYLSGLDREYNTLVSTTFDTLGFSQTKVTPGNLESLPEFRLGSPNIPHDMIAQVHHNERILTAEQNKEYTEQLISGNNYETIQLGLQDIVTAIKQQTTDLISYLQNMSFNTTNNSMLLNMSPTMGNTRVV